MPGQVANGWDANSYHASIRPTALTMHGKVERVSIVMVTPLGYPNLINSLALTILCNLFRSLRYWILKSFVHDSSLSCHLNWNNLSSKTGEHHIYKNISTLANKK